MEIKTLPQLATSILPILDVGMYESRISPLIMAEDFYNMLDEDDDRTSDDEKCFKNKEYDNFIREKAQFIADTEWLPIMKQFGVVSIKFTDWFHPREYNFSTDYLDIEIKVEDDFEKRVTPILKDIIENHKWAKEYINDNFKSHSGFISYMPATYEDIVKFNSKYCYAAALTLLMIDYGYDVEAVQEIFEELVYEKCNYEDYVEWN